MKSSNTLSVKQDKLFRTSISMLEMDGENSFHNAFERIDDELKPVFSMFKN